ncbi:MAG: hypothetical protein AABY22_11355 [Nanoarchaeota archaeon]
MLNKYGLQEVGNRIIVSLQTRDKQELLEDFYGFWNHGATKGELQWLNDSENCYAYFWTTREKLIKSLIHRHLFDILNKNPDKYKNKKNGAIKEATEKARETFKKFKEEDVVSISLDNYDEHAYLEEINSLNHGENHE